MAARTSKPIPGREQGSARPGGLRSPFGGICFLQAAPRGRGSGGDRGDGDPAPAPAPSRGAPRRPRSPRSTRPCDGFATRASSTCSPFGRAPRALDGGGELLATDAGRTRPPHAPLAKRADRLVTVGVRRADVILARD